jgi:two-component system cell cycle sensor histidine kinase/response regulator CckA
MASADPPAQDRWAPDTPGAALERGIRVKTNPSGTSADGVRVGLVGGGRAGAALLDLLLDWSEGRVTVVIDPRQAAPALERARVLGIPTAAHHLDVFTHPVDVVLEATGQHAVLEELRQARPSGVEVIGAASLRFFWTLLQGQVKAVRELRARENRLETLLALNRELSRIQPLESLLGRIAEACGALLGTDSVGFRLLEGDDLVVAGTWGEGKEALLSQRLKIGEGLSGRVAATGEPLMVLDPANDSRMAPAYQVVWRRFGFRAYLGVPVKVGARVVGVLSTQTRRAEAFSPADLTAAKAFASQAAVALENSRLLQETRRAYEELAQTQSQLTQANKMEAVGRLAGGIAHDFNNLLTVILGRSHLLMGPLRAGDPLRQGIELIEKTAGRAADLTRQLLAFSRKQILQPTSLDLNGVVADMEEMLGRLIGEDITLVTTFDPELGLVTADPTQVEQVIINLVVNARDAMPWGGRLSIETANVDLDVAYVRRHAGSRVGAHVRVAVGDTGVGMPSEVQAHIFEPFFTTKGPGLGTGLGLATVYGIVKQSEGYIEVDSEPGRGTTFSIYLPRVAEALAPAKPKAAAAQIPRGTETVLLVEDEEEVRALARDFLRSTGYTVLDARHGGEALLACERHAGPIQLMVTDVVMPQMSGRELAERLASLRPKMKVLYMSGYTDNAVLRHGVLDANTTFLQKPFMLDALAWKVREVLDTADDRPRVGTIGGSLLAPRS